MEFLRNVFTDFIFEKMLSHEALVAGRVIAISNNLKNSQRQLCKELQMK